jgi:hypothetical protein
VLKDSAALEDASLGDAIEPYRNAFMADPSHYYSGVNALMLTTLRVHLGGDATPADSEALLGGVRWAVTSALRLAPRDYWARASQALLSLLCFDAAMVQREHRAAVAAADHDWFALDSSLQALTLLRDLGFRAGGDRAGHRHPRARAEALRAAVRAAPGVAVLGHMIDAPDRPKRASRPRSKARRRARSPLRSTPRAPAAGDLALEPMRGRRRPAVPRGRAGARPALPGDAAAGRARVHRALDPGQRRRPGLARPLVSPCAPNWPTLLA